MTICTSSDWINKIVCVYYERAINFVARMSDVGVDKCVTVGWLSLARLDGLGQHGPICWPIWFGLGQTGPCGWVQQSHCFTFPWDISDWPRFYCNPFEPKSQWASEVDSYKNMDRPIQNVMTTRPQCPTTSVSVCGLC